MLQINGIAFQKFDFGQNAVLLKPAEEETISPIQLSQIAESIYDQQLPEIKEVITGIQDICLVLKNKQSFNYKKLASSTSEKSALKLKLLKIEVDFSQGLDWEMVEQHCKMTRENCIKLLTSTSFQFQMYGFIPGFMYLEGLPKQLETPRKKSPRKKVEAGSIGIGGKQFGVYNIESPGGWNIIGKIKQPLFNATKIPPLDVKVSDQIKLVSI